MSGYPVHIPSCVFITGATGGFGKAFAERFASLGCSLVLHGRDTKRLTTLCQNITDKYKVKTYPVVFDICDKEGTLNALRAIPDSVRSQIDVLINNAGGALGLDKFQDTDEEDLEQMMAMNNASLIRITRQILPHMTHNKKGHIINIGSIAGNWPYGGGHVYCAVKAFVRQFSLALRSDLVGTNVRVTNIEPGIAETNFSIARFKGDTEKAAKVYANTVPLTAEDVAESVLWAACLPPHVNINTLEVMPTQQSFSPLHIERQA